MVHFGLYLKDYLESARITQTEFAKRLGISQKHMNEILNAKKNITLEMAGTIERLTGIGAQFILKIEHQRKIRENLLRTYGSEEALREHIKGFPIKELKKREWVIFRDETNVFQKSIDLLDFLKVKDFNVFQSLEERVLFKKSGEDYNKLGLWIARCDALSEQQEVKAYESNRFEGLIDTLSVEAYENEYDEERVKGILNEYGILFVVEKALPGSKVRGVFKVNGTTPAIYLTKNYASKDSFYFELFHELKHCKSDYNEAKKKVFAGGDVEKETAADTFALETMINNNVWKEIVGGELTESRLLKISKLHKIPMSFIVGRLAYEKRIPYTSPIYQNYKNQ